MEKYKISVIIPVYNAEKYLRRCLESVINNTYKNLEIICVNDGSTDNSLDLLKDYTEKDQRIIVIDKPNGGVSSARNAGIEISSGEYIAFVDSDDWVHYQYFEAFAHICESNDIDVALVRHLDVSDDNIVKQNVDVNNVQIKVGSWDIIFNDSALCTFVWARIYSRELVGKFLFPTNITYGEDQLFNHCVLSKKETPAVAIIEAPLYYYFLRPESVSHTTKELKRLEQQCMAIEYMSGFADNSCSEMGEILLRERIAKLILHIIYVSKTIGKPYTINVKKYRKMLKMQLRKLRKNRFEKKSKLIFLYLVTYCPFIYRLYRNFINILNRRHSAQ